MNRGECTKCKGHFQQSEQVYLSIENKNYCEACYKEWNKEFCGHA